MQVSVSQPAVIANTAVVVALRSAQADATKAAARLDATGFDAQVASLTSSAAAASQQALAGALALGSSNLLDPTTHRYAQHAVRELTAAANYSQRAAGDKDAIKLLGAALDRGEVAARLGADAGDRSLAHPMQRAGSDSPVGDGTGSSSGSGSSWSDGAWVDSMGNPTRSTGDSWSGPDGVSYGSDGGVSSSSGRGGGDSWSGPDGTSYSGI